MSTKYTPDGYPYDTAGEWDFVRNASWKSNKPANEFLAGIGQRNYPGLKGLIQDLGKGPAKWLATAIAALITVVPVPGAQVLGPALVAAIQSGATNKIKDIISKAFIEMQANLGSQQFIQEVKNLVLMDNQTVESFTDKFYSMDEVGRTYAVHHILNDLIRHDGDVIAGNFDKDEVMRKTYMSFIAAVTCFPTGAKLIHTLGQVPTGRAFFAGDGFPVFASHMTSQDLCNFNNPDHVKRMKSLGLMLASIEITQDENEYNDYLNGVNSTSKNIFENLNLSGIEWGKVGSVASVLALLGVIYSKIKG